jgi:hypothetical protein
VAGDSQPCLVTLRSGNKLVGAIIASAADQYLRLRRSDTDGRESLWSAIVRAEPAPAAAPPAAPPAAPAPPVTYPPISLLSVSDLGPVRVRFAGMAPSMRLEGRIERTWMPVCTAPCQSLFLVTETRCRLIQADGLAATPPEFSAPSLPLKS